MADVDFWVMVDVGDDGKTGRWFGQKQRTEPEVEDPHGRHVWIRLKDTDDIWIIENWNFEESRLPKKYRGLSPTNFTYDFESKTWSHESAILVSWQMIRDARMAMLSSTDWIIVKYAELGEPIPQEWLDYRKTLRDFPETHKDLDPELAQHILNFTFDPDTKKRRLERGLSIDVPEWTGDD